MDLNLQGKNSIVTGGSRGIGKGIAEALAKEGCNVSICARHKDELETAANELREFDVDILSVQADLTQQEGIEEVGELAAFLASEKASFMNGANYRVDGGSVASI